ncbi:MAG: hypothetical protein U1E72_16935 [Burkholderiaceae bacterium]
MAAALADQHVAAQLGDVPHLGGVGDGLQRVRRLGVQRHVEQLQQRVPGREGHRQLEHEAVQLRLGQRVGAFQLDRVLRGQHAEGLGQRMGGAGVRHLPLLHGLQQRRLRARRGAVDLVHQHQLGEDRAGPELEARCTRGGAHVDLRTRHVGGQQVGRALHARPVQAQRGGERLGRVGLAQAGQAFDDDVAAGEDGGHQVGDELVLADDDAAEQGAQVLQAAVRVGEGLVARRGGGRQRCALALIHACT